MFLRFRFGFGLVNGKSDAKMIDFVSVILSFLFCFFFLPLLRLIHLAISVIYATGYFFRNSNNCANCAKVVWRKNKTKRNSLARSQLHVSEKTACSQLHGSRKLRAANFTFAHFGAAPDNKK